MSQPGRRGLGGVDGGVGVMPRDTQLQVDVAGRLPAIVGILGQRAPDDVVHGRWRQRLTRRGRRRLAVQDRGDDARLAVAGKRALARAHLVQQRAQREDVGARIHRARFELLGRHVLERADQHALRRDRRVARCAGLAAENAFHRRAGQAEVQQLGAGARQHDVGRLEIAMDHAVAMRPVERIGDLGAVADDLVRRQRPARQAAGQRLAFEVLHDEEGDAVLLADVVEHADVRVVQGRDRAGLAVEPLTQLRVVREDGREDLDGDRPVEPGVAGACTPGPCRRRQSRQLSRTGPVGPLARATSRRAIIARRFQARGLLER